MHYWVDLQSVHGFHCCDNIALRLFAVHACTRMPGCAVLGGFAISAWVSGVLVLTLCLVTFRVSHRRCEMYDLYVGHVRLFVCLCLSLCRLVALCPHYMYCTDPDVIWENGSGAPYLCIISRFAIGARVSLL